MDFEAQTASSFRTRLPTVSTPLLGREDEVKQAETMLALDDVRLLTLIGAGGTGKTRLALHLATNWLRGGHGQVAFVPLDAIDDPKLVMPAIAQAVGVSPSGGQVMDHALQSMLHDSPWLLVLDSFEHLLDATPAVANLLAASPSLTLLVTSRVRLRLREEQVMPVLPLALSGSAGSTESAAVRLFVARARATDPTFAPTPAALQAIADICQRLDGLPLAIELVAPRIRHMSVEELRERLDRRLPLLTGGARDQPSRLQTMRNAITWSFDLLAPADRMLFQRIAVFSDGFTASSAARITPPLDAGDPGVSVLDGLATLVDASLLLAEPVADGTTRYRQLETIREFALEQLAGCGDEEDARDAHAAWCLEFAQDYALASLHPTGDTALARLAAEHGNLRSALAWFDRQDATDHLLTLATSLGRFWSEMGHYQEGHFWLNLALNRAPNDAALCARGNVALGLIEIYRGAFQEATTRLRAVLAEPDPALDPWTAALANIGLGGLATMAGDDVLGSSHLRHVFSCADHMADARLQDVLRGWASCNLGILARERGDLSQANARLTAALDHLEAAGYVTGTIMVLSDLGDLARDRLDYARALEWYGEALRRGRTQAGTRVVADAIEGVGLVAVAAGDAAHGTRLLGAAAALRERLGLRYRVARNQLDLARADELARASLGAERRAELRSAGRRLSPDEALALASEPIAITAPMQRAAELTPRERDVLALLATGLSDAAIASALYLSVRTVENHVAHIRTKLGVSSRSAAVRVAGIVPIVPLTNEYSTPEK